MKSLLAGVAAGALLAAPAVAGGEKTRHESIVQITGKHHVSVGGCSAGVELFAAELHGEENGEPVMSSARICTEKGLSAAEKRGELTRFRTKLSGQSGIKGAHRAEILRRLDLKLTKLR